MFPKEHKLTSSEFPYVYEKGFKIKGEFGVLIGARPVKGSEYKIGIVVNKKVGNAVTRHFVSRRIRSLFRENLKEYPTSLLLQYVAYQNTSDYKKLSNEFNKQYIDMINHFGL